MRKKIITTIIILIIGVGGLIAVNDSVNGFLLSPDINKYSSNVKTMMTILPFMFALMVIFGALKNLGADTQEEIAAQINWTRYGERLKLAYAAKFGGDNPGFDQEVDLHIKILVDTDKGYTRQLAKDWVERMSKFVGIHWLRMENSNEVA